MTTKTGIIFLQKDKFQIYSPYLPSMFEFRFIPDIVRDFDVVNRELLENLLKVFIVNNKIPVSSMIIVLSDSASFIKDFTAPSTPNPQQNPSTGSGQIARQPVPAVPTLDDLQNEADQFIEHVPFDSVSGKTYPLPNGVRAYATNQEMFESIRSALEKQGFIIEAVIPGFAFSPEIGAKQGMDGGSIATILQRVNMVKAYNLLADFKPVVENVRNNDAEENNNSVSEVASPQDQKKKKKFILIASAGFLLLIIITGWILIGQFSERPYKPPPAATNSSNTPVASPQPTQDSTNLALDAKDLTVQVTSTSTSATTAQTLVTALTKYGFKSVTPQIQEGLSASSGLLIFSEKTNVAVKNVVTEEVKKVAPNIIVQEKPGSAFDIVIIF